jgi:putative membrane protein
MEADIDLTSLGAASSALAQGISEISNGLNALRDGFTQTDAAILAQTGQQSIEEANEAAILSLSQQIVALQADPVGNAAQIESLSGIVALLNANNSLVANLRLGICGDGTQDVPGLVSALNELSTQFQSFDGAIQDLPGQLGALFDGIIALKTGVGQLYDSSVAFGSGLDAYLDGTQSIQGGLHSLCAGFGDALDACSDLHSGVESLRLGLYGLADGSRQLRYATRGMDRSIESTIDDLLEDYLPGDFALLSFVSGKNDNVRSVQFILKSDNISFGE